MTISPGDAVLVHDPLLPVMAATVLDVFEANQTVRVQWARPGCEGVYYASYDHVTRYESLEEAQQEVRLMDRAIHGRYRRRRRAAY